MTQAQIGAALGRTRTSVHARCKRLGISRVSKIRQNGSNAWTEADEDALSQMVAARMVHREIAKAMGRTTASVSMKIFALKLTPRKTFVSVGSGHQAEIGSERLHSGKGLRMRKVSHEGPQGNRWKRVDVIDWEAVHGPVPDGYLLLVTNKHLPRTPDNLRLVKKEEAWATIRGADLSPEVLELMKLRQQISKELNRRSAA
ncbi:hypothetical protein [Tardiphaga sp. 862_B3_N1_1]|uniref:hypothetical protein n=1 Tax=Tardiphaga sp. 862_B3_N1_1 TaxID=3240763 RepID=UPI003F88A849